MELEKREEEKTPSREKRGSPPFQPDLLTKKIVKKIVHIFDVIALKETLKKETKKGSSLENNKTLVSGVETPSFLDEFFFLFFFFLA